MAMAKRTENHAVSLRGFTLIELLVAIAVLLVVIIATSRIFGTASHVVGMGQASANIMQEAAALERRLREDIANLSHEGFFAIRQVAVPNDINVTAGGGLLNPFLPDDAIIRADQLVFFTTNVDTPQTADFAGAINILAQGTAARVYYGHAFQLPNAAPVTLAGDVANAHDPGVLNDPYPGINAHFNYLFGELTPWNFGSTSMVRTRIGRGSDLGGPSGTNVFSRFNAGAEFSSIDATQPDALSWLLARQAVLLVDDDTNDPHTNSKTSFLGSAFGGAGGIRTARSIFIDHPGHGFSRELRNGRVDAAATRLEDVRRYAQWRWDDGVRRPWSDISWAGGVRGDQRSIIASSMYYPRAERYAPSMHRVDQALTNNVIGTSVSSFIVEWTWEEGAGEVRDEHGDVLWFGFRPNCWDYSTGSWCIPGGFHQPEHPWFGLNWPDRGVGFVAFEDAAINDHDGGNLSFYERANFDVPQTIFYATGMNNNANNIERYFGPGQQPGFNPYGTGDDIRIYEALFGYNRDTPLDRFGNPEFDLGYTPWPTAIRVTVVFHDPAGRMEHGREFQFVIDLPRRTR